jgi:DNA-binding transcriptional LysR family regulator
MNRRHRSSSRRYINLEQLESFVTLAEAGGITAAARRLSLSQPTVSQHLQRLETYLRRRLIVRTSDGATLTAEGERLLPFARGLLRLGRQFGEDDSAAPLRLGACSNIGVYLLPALLEGLQRKGQVLPQVTIASNPEVRQRLLTGELDVGLLEWWDEPPGFHGCIWRHEPLVAILPLGHELAGRESLSLADLRSVPLLGGESGTGTGRLLRGLLAANETLEVAMELGSTEAVKRAVAAGLGASLVLEMSVSDSLVAMRPLVPRLVKALHLIWRHGVSREHVLLAHLLAHSALQPLCDAGNEPIHAVAANNQKQE